MNDLIDKLRLIPSASLMLWLTDAATELSNGFISGLGAGVVVGGVSASQTPTADAQAISINGAIGVLVTAGANGLKRLVIWHDTHPIPNPFRHVQAQAQSTATQDQKTL